MRLPGANGEMDMTNRVGSLLFALAMIWTTAHAGNFSKSPVGSPGGWAGTGPFRVAGFEPGRRLHMRSRIRAWAQSEANGQSVKLAGRPK